MSRSSTWHGTVFDLFAKACFELGLHRLLPMFSTPHTSPALLQSLHIQLAQRVLALHNAWEWSREEHGKFAQSFAWQCEKFCFAVFVILCFGEFQKTL
jgi:hypothetical protein